MAGCGASSTNATRRRDDFASKLQLLAQYQGIVVLNNQILSSLSVHVAHQMQRLYAGEYHKTVHRIVCNATTTYIRVELAAHECQQTENVDLVQIIECCEACSRCVQPLTTAEDSPLRLVLILYPLDNRHADT